MGEQHSEDVIGGGPVDLAEHFRAREISEARKVDACRSFRNLVEGDLHRWVLLRRPPDRFGQRNFLRQSAKTKKQRNKKSDQLRNYITVAALPRDAALGASDEPDKVFCQRTGEFRFDAREGVGLL